MTLPFNLEDEFRDKLDLPKPKYLYKFHRFNLHLIEMLTNAKFHMSKRSDLNDPLDSSYTLTLKDYLNLYFEKHPRLQNKEHEELMSGIFQRKTNIDDNELHLGNDDNWMDSIDPLRSKLRLTCFTEDGLNPLLWSHYGDNHTGVCLKFDLDKEPNLKSVVLPVSYTDKLIEAKSPADFNRCLVTKLKSWEIEREWRIFSDREKFGFNQDALVEIVFGLRVADSNLEWFNQFRENLFYGHAPVHRLKIRGSQICKIDEWDFIVERI